MTRHIIGMVYDIDLSDPDHPAAQARDGWYVMATADEVTAEQAPYVDAARPLPCVWAGDDARNPAISVMLRFADAAQAAEVLA